MSEVTSVNSKTGEVVLKAGDVEAIPTAQAGAANGVATLDSGTKLTGAQIPSSVATKAEVSTEKERAEAAEALKVPLSQKGAKGGVAELNEESKLPEAQLPGAVVSGSANPTAKGQRLVSVGTGNRESRFLPSAEFDVREYSGSILPNVEEDQAAAINAFAKELPAGATILFPEANPQSATKISRYFCGGGIELQTGIGYRGTAMDRTVFAPLPGFTGHQLVRNWAAADGTAFGVAPNTTATPVYYLRLEHMGLDLAGQSNLMALALVHCQERTIIEHIGFFTHYGKPEEVGSGNVAFAMLANNDTSGQCAGRFDLVHFVGYGGGWLHWLFLDGTNNGTTTNWIRDVVIRGWTSPTGPADGTICSDSPVYLRAVDGLKIEGHCEAMPPAISEDTAIARMIDCSRVDLSDLRVSPGGYVVNRPAVRATQTGTAPALYPMTSPHMRDINLYRENGEHGWTSREDEGCEITSGSTTVKNTHAQAGDRYLPVSGPGIPSGAIVSEVVPGEKWVLSKAAFSTGTVTLTRSCNIIEDETGGKTRHFQYDATYFDPRFIYDYSGARIDWVNGGGSEPVRRIAERFASDARALLEPENVVAESLRRGDGIPLTGTSIFKSGEMFLVPLLLFPGDVVKKLHIPTGNTESKALTHSWVALFGPRRELLGISADQGNAAWTASAAKEIELEKAVTASLVAVYFVGILIVGETMPNVQGISHALTATQAPVQCGLTGAGLTTPSTCPLVASAPTASNGVPYLVVL